MERNLLEKEIRLFEVRLTISAVAALQASTKYNLVCASHKAKARLTAALAFSCGIISLVVFWKNK